jgi:3-oxoacyl-[acyl-carrier-protein] synthase II
MNATLSTQPTSSESEIVSRPTPIITGIGLLTPLGATAQQTWCALLDGKFITDHARAAGEYDPASPRVIQMARRAADEAMHNANWSPNANDYTTIVGTSKGSIASWLGQSPACGFALGDSSHPPNWGFTPPALADIAAALAPPYAPRLTLSGACASGLIALIRAAMLIESGHANRVLVVAAEASLHPLFLASFQRLGVLPRKEIGCRPFDESREGFLMSEAAAAVCLEASTASSTKALQIHSECSASALSSPHPRIAIEHYALGADATHLTSPDPTGRVLRHLINKVTANQPVELVHAHGTGTLANDPIELAALESVFASALQTPCLYSHKAALGHSLGAAGLVSVVLNVLVHQHDCVPPNIRTTRPLPTQHVAINPTTHRMRIRRSLALAAGFGGATAAVRLISQ